MSSNYKLLNLPSEIIAARRQELSLTQAELSRKLGYANRNFISMVESGKSGVPVDRSIDFAAALEMSRTWFIEKVLRLQFPHIAAEIFDERP